jgi:hypothetical protein
MVWSGWLNMLWTFLVTSGRTLSAIIQGELHRYMLDIKTSLLYIVRFNHVHYGTEESKVYPLTIF